MTRGLRVETKRRLAKATLDRPEQLNPFSIEVLEDLRRLLGQWNADPDLSVVLFTGTGRAFSAGLDVKQMVNLPPEEKRRVLSLNHEVVRLLLESPKVLVVANNGFALGMGFITNLCADFRFAASDAEVYFQLPELDIGLFPATGALSLPHHHFPPGLAARLVFACEKLTLEGAISTNFLSGTWPKDELEGAAVKFCRNLARKNRDVTSATKACLVAERAGLLEALEMEKRFALRLMGGEET